MQNNNVRTKGFSDLNKQLIPKVEKLLKNHINRYRHKFGNFQELNITQKEIHGVSQNAVHEVNVNLLIDGKVYHSDTQDHNVLAALEDALTTVERAAEH